MLNVPSFNKSPIGAGALSALRGGFKPAFLATLSSSLTLQRGIGTYNFTGQIAPDVSTVTDFEGIVHDVQPNEARFQGVRRVENLVAANSEDITAGDWAAANTAVLTDYQTLSLPNSLDSALLTVPNPGDGRKVVFSMELSGSGTVYLYVQDGVISTTVANFNLSATPQRVSVSHTQSASSTQCGFRIKREATSTATSVTIGDVQCEDVTGQTVGETGVPSEYVSVGVGTGAEEITSWDYSGLPWFVGTGLTRTATEFTGTGANGFAYTTVNQDAGSTGLLAITFTILTQTGGSIRVVSGITGVGSFVSSPGTYTQVVRSGGGLADLINGVGCSNFTGTFTVDSIKKLDHGSNVDGVKYFDYHNTLSVEDNIVYGTGGRGAELTTDPEFDTDSGDGVDTVDFDIDAGISITGGKLVSTAVQVVSPATGGAFDVPQDYALYELEYEIAGVAPLTFNWSRFTNLPITLGEHKVVRAASAVGLSGLLLNIGTEFLYFRFKKITPASSFVTGTKFGRRVENLIGNSEDITVDWAPLFNKSTVDDYNTVTLQNHVLGQVNIPSYTATIGHAYVLSCTMWVDSGTATVTMQCADGALNSCALTTTPTRFRATSAVPVVSASVLGFIAHPLGAQGTFSLHVSNVQLEDVTGQANQNPGEYVRRGVDSFPYSGTGLDGIAEFPTTNPNQVSVNYVVTADVPTFPRTPGDGVLIEGARTNYVLNSDNVNSFSANIGVSVSATATPYINGEDVAWTVLETATSPWHGVQLLESGATGAGFSAVGRRSLYVQPAGRDYITIYEPSGGAREVSFNLATGTIDTGVTNTLPANITRLRDDIYRIDFESLTKAAVDDRFALMELYFSNDGTPYGGGGAGYTGDVTKGVRIGGSMAEIATFPSSYIPTAGTALDRGAEKLTYDVANFPQTDGSAFATLTPLVDVPAVNAVHKTAISLGTTGRSPLYIAANGTSYQPSSWDGVNTANTIAVATPFNRAFRLGAKWETGGTMNVYGDGLEDTTPPSYDGAFTATTDMTIGSLNTLGSNTVDGGIKDVQIYNKALNDAKMQEKTS